MYDIIIQYFVIGLFVSSGFCLLASASRFYKPNVLYFIVAMILWPYMIVAYLYNLIRLYY